MPTSLLWSATFLADVTHVLNPKCHPCLEPEPKQHKATHEQILALLTPDQHQKLQAVSDGPEHCHKDKDSHTAPEENAVHA